MGNPVAFALGLMLLAAMWLLPPLYEASQQRFITAAALFVVGPLAGVCYVVLMILRRRKVPVGHRQD